MNADVRTRADDRLGRALEESGAWDPRESYRRILRSLRQRSETEYEDAVAAFQHSVIEAIADRGAEPLVTWLEFGLDLAWRLSPGRDVVVDETGVAAPFEPPPSWRSLILHLPEDPRARAFVIGLPPKPTRAQQACVALLAHGSVRLPES